MANALARWTMTSVPEREREALVAQREGKEPPKKEGEGLRTVFIDPKILTFPIVVLLVKGGWEAFQVLPLNWASSVWVPFWGCIIIAILVAISNLTTGGVNIPNWLLGLSLAIVNGLLMFAAVLGIPEATALAR